MLIISAPHTVLSQQAKAVEEIDKEIRLLIEEMKKTLLVTNDPQGVGLAAPQVGQSLQIFIAKPTDTSPFKVFINPTVTPLSSELAPIKRPRSSKHSHKLEGCLSLPSIWGFVLRCPKVKVEYTDEK